MTLPPRESLKATMAADRQTERELRKVSSVLRAMQGLEVYEIHDIGRVEQVLATCDNEVIEHVVWHLKALELGEFWFAKREVTDRYQMLRAHVRAQRVNKRDADFVSRWNFVVSFFSESEAAENAFTHLEQNYQRNLKRYYPGVRMARILYRKDALKSLGPLLKWAFHRSIVIGIVKHYFPAIDSFLRLFR